MLKVSIPGYRELQLSHLVLDYNGTLACDGEIIQGVKQTLDVLAEDLQIHILTADTFGTAQARLADRPWKLVTLAVDKQDVCKLDYVRQLGAESTACIGNGRNDRLMLKEAALSIAVIQQEGAARDALLAAEVVCPDIVAALQLLTNPLRLTATLRS